MHIAHLVFVCLTVSFTADTSLAEYRTVLIQVTRDKDGKGAFTIHSDVQAEQVKLVPADKAAAVVRSMKGWGSSAGVYIVRKGSVSASDLKPVFDAVFDNVWLDLRYFGDEVPKVLGDHFLRGREK